jgi:hypothetical protein
LSLDPAETDSTSSPFKRKAKPHIPRRICGEESATAANLIRVTLSLYNLFIYFNVTTAM